MYESFEIINKLEQLKAAEGKLLNTLAFFERKVRRWYSREFHTPLFDVYKLDYQFILQQYYESIIEGYSYNELLEVTQRNLLDELSESIEEEDQKYADSLIKKQQEQLEKQKVKDTPKTQSLNKTQSNEANNPKIPEINLKFDESLL